MSQTATLEEVTRDPTSFIDRSVLDQILGPICEALDATDERGEIDTVRLAAALHQFVYTTVEYGTKLKSGLNHTPRETVLEAGNCADQSLLLYALYREVGIDARITSVKQNDGSGRHAFVECGFDGSLRDIIEVLGDYYRETGVISSGQYHYFADDGQVYFVADPVASRYLGDHDELHEMGYIDQDGELQITRRFLLYRQEGGTEHK